MQSNHTPRRARMVLPFLRAFFVFALTLGAVPWALHAGPVHVAKAQASDLFFSEYIEGSSNNKALEIYNGTGTPVDLAAGGYSIGVYFNGSSSSTLNINLTGTVAVGDVYVVAHASADPDVLAQADLTSTASWFNGDDAIALRKNGTNIDVIGQIGSDPGSEWGSGLQSTADNTLRRNTTICSGDANGSDPFVPATQWDGFAQNTFGGLGSHTSTGCPDNAPVVKSTTPANGAPNIAVNADITIFFSEAVTAPAAAFTMSCTSSGSHTFALSGGPSTFTLNPDVDFAASESCTVAVTAASISDQDSTPTPMAADYSFTFSTVSPPCGGPGTVNLIHDIQGSGTAAVLTGSRTIQGVVVGVFQGSHPQFSGFYVQEEDAEVDADPATSEGIFVYESGTPAVVSVGQVVRVTGTVQEYSGLTEIAVSNASNIELCPVSPVSTTPTDVSLPVTDWERYEGMLVRFPAALTVTETYQLGRYGSVLLANGRQYQFTHLNAPSFSGYTAFLDLFGRSTITLDDASQQENPDPVIYPAPALSASNTLRSGYTVTNLTGILDAHFGSYRVQPTQPVTFTASNPRPTAAPSVGGTLKVASFNVLNYFNGPAFPTPRGASTAAEFTRQRAKTISAISGLNADVVGLMEMENDASGADSAIQDLVNGLNAVMGAGTYSYIDTGVIGTDQIRVALIYKPAVVTPVGAFMVDTDPINNRPPLAQTFKEISTGELFTVVVNHLKSKGCDDATGLDLNQNDGQSCYNARRLQQAQRLLTFVNSTIIPTSGDPDVLLIGDFNAYAQEDPIRYLTGNGFVDESAAFGGVNAYSYVYDGQSGYLDQALATTSLSTQMTGVVDWHINADEPTSLDYNTDYKSVGQQASFYAPDAYRASDHDPVLIGLALGTVVQPPAATPPAAASTPTIGVFDPALSKIGILAAGQIGLPGEHLTWYITATNQGTGAGTNIQVVDQVRPELRIDSVEADRGTFTINGQTVTFTIPTLNPGESVQMRVNTTVLESPLSGTLTNDANLTGTGGDGSTATRAAAGQVPVATSLPATGYAPKAQAENRVSLWWIVLAAALIAAGGFVLRLKWAKR